jgi:hypothetical protein
MKSDDADDMVIVAYNVVRWGEFCMAGNGQGHG